MLSALLVALSLSLSPATVKNAFSTPDYALVLVDCETGETFASDTDNCTEALPPCSTFKIWNTAIGLEVGEIKSADAPFWKWDGQKRWREAWNADQTLRSAFKESCVPAYQDLARRIGAERMGTWIEKLQYGDKNMSAGLDVFWLPGAERKPLLITPFQQVALMQKLVNQELGLSENTRAVLKDVMKYAETERGTLYGKTGTGDLPDGTNVLGWYVGYVESGGKTYAFAATMKGKDIMGPNTRDAIQKLFTELKLL